MNNNSIEIFDKLIGDNVLVVYINNEGILSLKKGQLDPGEGFIVFDDGGTIWHGDVIALGDIRSLEKWESRLKPNGEY